MDKLLSIISKPADMSRETFLDYWQNTHGKLAKKLPYLKRYVQNHIVKHERISTRAPQADGFVELWFNSHEAMQAAFASKVGKQLVLDEKASIANIDAYSVDEVVIYDH